MNYQAAFESMHPDFFDSPSIRDLPEDQVFRELVLDLKTEKVLPCRPCPEQIRFGIYTGERRPLLDAVAAVNGNWVQYFRSGDRVLCGFDGLKPVSFCLLDDMGVHEGKRIAGPGCVGTVPEWRRQGIGLDMVRRATEILAGEGYDLSWIFYTHLDRWYAKLGYRLVLSWNCRGFV